MKIVVLTGSPRKHGNSNYLADEFCIGAKAAGHAISRFDVAAQAVQPCMACEYCHKHDGNCAIKDDMENIYPKILAADMIVLVTPLYYFGISAQLKTAIDRFYAINKQLKDKQAVLLSVCADTDDWAPDALIAHFRTICRYCRWTERGILIAPGFHEAAR